MAVNWTEKIGNRYWSKDFEAGFVTKATRSDDEPPVYRPCGNWAEADFTSEEVTTQIGAGVQADVVAALSIV